MIAYRLIPVGYQNQKTFYGRYFITDTIKNLKKGNQGTLTNFVSQASAQAFFSRLSPALFSQHAAYTADKPRKTGSDLFSPSISETAVSGVQGAKMVAFSVYMRPVTKLGFNLPSTKIQRG
ncbi:hypothetical protein CYPRO_2036 [Cyclonatronum proteinivorum]|uniref:Uncharacterized protein n=1 Tax=Cyclonatronum proteinivorum TaxID=1457365 RepID=A0A345ULD4_9BACT|nr:hypothetical protein [Cyclonatronum proteinivorum]AXJ01286.1 hypothetical protein CYPRO_2036 [Cyclonatronum proteinivorum]